MPSENQVDLFLLGKTGHGKSSTGNSILGRDAFGVSDGAESETFVVQVGWTRHQGRVIKVVDGPGTCETRLDIGKATEKMTKDMYQGIMQCPDGFHAMVLVLKYGNRYTQEEADTVSNLKSLFGADFVRDFCIVVFTHGELYEMKHRRDPKPFSTWCQEQTGSMKLLFEECSYRTMLFYNMDDTKTESQISELLSIVDGLESKGVRYTSELFEKYAKEREHLIVKNNAPFLREQIQSKVDLLMQDVRSIEGVTDYNDETKGKLRQLREDARALEVEIAIQDKGTGVLDPLRRVAMNIQDSISNQEKALTNRSDKLATEASLEKIKVQYQESLAELKRVQNQRRGGRGRCAIM